MKIRIPRIKIREVLFLFSWVLVVYYTTYNLIDSGTTIKNGYVYLLCTIISGLILIFTKDGFSLNRNSIKIIGGLFFFVFWIILGSVVCEYGDMATSNIRTYTIYIIYIILSSLVIFKLNIFNKVIFLSMLELFIILLERFFVYEDYLNNIDLINSFFRIGNYTRITFGFSHVNSCGNLCVLEISLLIYALIYFYKRSNKKKIKLLYLLVFIPSILLTGYLTLYTSTRTAIVCSLLFICLLLYKASLRVRDKNVKKLIKMVSLFTFFLAILVGIFKGIFSAGYFASITGRNNEINLNLLSNIKSLIFGIGFVNSGVFGIGGFREATTWLDNYYVYILITSGVVGFVINIATLFLIGNGIIKNKKHSSIEDEVIITIYIIFCIYGLLETCVIEPHFIFSAVFLPNVMAYSYKNKKIEVEENHI